MKPNWYCKLFATGRSPHRRRQRVWLLLEALEDRFVLAAGGFGAAFVLDYQSVTENEPVGALVGRFLSDDCYAHTYQLLTFPSQGGGSGAGGGGETTFFLGQTQRDLPGGPSLPFYIDNGNELRTNVVFDYETLNSYRILVRQIGGEGQYPSPQEFTIAINNVNETPVLHGGQAFSVNENSNAGTCVGTVAFCDPDTDPPFRRNRFSIVGGNTDCAFAIDSCTGELTVKNAAALDYETNPCFTLCIRIEDAYNAELSDTKNVKIRLRNGNEAPTLVGGQSFCIDENSGAGTCVGSVVYTDPDQVAGFKRDRFSIVGGNTDCAFAIDSCTGELTVKNVAALDFETNPCFTLCIRIEDACNGELSDTREVKIRLRDVNEAPVLIGGQTFCVDEIPGSSQIVTFFAASFPVQGIGTVASYDPDTKQAFRRNVYSIVGGNTDCAFAIDSCTGELTVKNAAALDFETNPCFTLCIRIEDACNSGLSNTTEVKVRLRNLNEAPVLGDGQSFCVDENSPVGTCVGSVAFTDPDQIPLFAHNRFSIVGGNIDCAFAINSKTGELTVKNPAALDYETNPCFTLCIRVEDTRYTYLSDTTEVKVRLRNVNEAPVLAKGQSFCVDENAATGTCVGTVTHSDPDQGGMFANNRYSIVGGNTGGAFAINSKTGELTVKNPAALNYEKAPCFTLYIRIADIFHSKQSDTEAVIVHLRNVNEAPVLKGKQSFSVDENSIAGTCVGIVQSCDPDTVPQFLHNRYSIVGGNTDCAFAIDAKTGKLTVKNPGALDFEKNPCITLCIRIEDACDSELSDTTEVKIRLRNLNEAPVLNGEQSFSVDENSIEGKSVGKVKSTDSDNVAEFRNNVYSIVSGNTGDAFAIDAETGELTVNTPAALDFETTPTFTLRVRIADAADGDLGDTKTVIVHLRNVNEAAVLTVGQSFNVDENSAAGTPVGTVQSTDFDTNDDFRHNVYSIVSGNAGDAFAIDPESGKLTVKTQAALNFEATPTFTLTIRIADAQNADLADTKTVAVNLRDVNEAPVLTVGQSFNVDENSAAGTSVGTVQSADFDTNDDFRHNVYSIVGGNTGDAFAIDPETGELTVKTQAALDFETTPTFTLSIHIADAKDADLADTKTVTVNLGNVNETPLQSPLAFSAGAPAVVAVGTPFQRTITFADFDIGWTVDINFGDASVDPANPSIVHLVIPQGAAKQFTLSHTWNAIDGYTVDITITNTAGATAHDSFIVSVLDPKQAAKVVGHDAQAVGADGTATVSTSVGGSGIGAHLTGGVPNVGSISVSIYSRNPTNDTTDPATNDLLDRVLNVGNPDGSASQVQPLLFVDTQVSAEIRENPNAELAVTYTVTDVVQTTAGQADVSVFWWDQKNQSWKRIVFTPQELSQRIDVLQSNGLWTVTITKVYNNKPSSDLAHSEPSLRDFGHTVFSVAVPVGSGGGTSTTTITPTTLLATAGATPDTSVQIRTTGFGSGSGLSLSIQESQTAGALNGSGIVGGVGEGETPPTGTASSDQTLQWLLDGELWRERQPANPAPAPATQPPAQSAPPGGEGETRLAPADADFAAAIDEVFAEHIAVEPLPANLPSTGFEENAAPLPSALAVAALVAGTLVRPADKTKKSAKRRRLGARLS